MGITDYIGGRGEAIAFVLLTKYCLVAGGKPYFWPHFLGEKCETFDFLVELNQAGEKTPFFFVQVKTTRGQYAKSRTGPRLRVKVSKKDIRRMASYPAPTYVIGVHEVEERAFVVRVSESLDKSISSITTTHEINEDTMRRLWDEVREFWRSHEWVEPASSFLN